jgi:hypothetical protein
VTSKGQYLVLEFHVEKGEVNAKTVTFFGDVESDEKVSK